MAIKKISANLLGNNAVTAASIAGGAISAADIADNSITAAKLSASTSPTFGGLTSTGDVSIGGADSNNAVLSLTADTGNWVFTNVRASRNLEISDSDGTGTVLTIDTSGKVGIGTTSPNANLEINPASGNSELKITSTDNSGNNIRFFQGTNSYLVASNNVYMSANGNTDMFNLVNGNVGIGETVPVAKLHIQGSGTSGQVTSSFLLENASSGTAGLDITGAAGSSRLRFLYGGGPSTGTNTLTEALNIVLEGSSAGNVGIGTSSFGATYDKLAVAGGINIQDDNNGKLEIGRYSSGAPNSYIKLGANSNSLKITNNTDGADIVTILNNSHTGIGSSAVSPAGVLHLDDGSNNVDLRLTSDLGGGNPATLRLLSYGVGGDNWIQSGTANSGATRAPLKFSGSDGNYICAVMNQTLGVTEGSFFRANNWHGASVNTIGGPAMEIGYAGSSGYLHGYNRNSSSYIPVSYDGIEHRWYLSGTGPNAVLNSNGQFLINFSNPDSTSNFLLGVDGSIGLGGDDFIAAGAGYGPSNSSAGAGTIKLYDTGTGNMNFNQTYSYARYYFYHGGNEIFRIEDGGYSGIYGYSFHYTTQYGSVGVGALNSGYHHTMTQSGPSTFYWNNRCEASGGFHTYSDERLKENVTNISGALDKVALMNGVTFNWIDAENRGGGDTGKQFGVIAQNMLEVDPELPILNPDPLATQEDIDNEELETDYYTMDYSRITPFLIEAIKELKTKLEAAEARITELEA